MYVCSYVCVCAGDGVACVRAVLYKQFFCPVMDNVHAAVSLDVEPLVRFMTRP